MHSVRIRPGRLCGTVSVPPSKSAAHRAIICACLADGVSRLEPIELSNDIKATIECMRALGAEISVSGRGLTIDGGKTFSAGNAVLDCGESGSTLRFLIPVAAAGNVSAEFIGHGKLPQRPIGVYSDCLPPKGIGFVTSCGLPLKISGQLESGEYRIPGDISSQFITGLLLALPLLDGDSDIILTSPAQSVGYIKMTTDIMKSFGVVIEETPGGWHIKGGQKFTSREFTVEGDWSQAAFFMTAGALGGDITIDNLSMSSAQGDKACVGIYRRFGARITEGSEGIRIRPGSLRAADIDARDIPDMVPALAVAAAQAPGQTVISGAERLRIKECDRLFAMTQGLTRLGADISETEDGLIINGVTSLSGGNAEGFNDHRIVMSLAVASAAAQGDIIITDMESVNKSYPSFFDDFRRLGGIADVIMGE